MNYVIEVKNVCKSFNGSCLLNEVNLNIKKGKIIGIIGANGSGKSVLFKLMCGFIRPDSGDIYIRGEKLGMNFDFPSDVGVLINSPGYIELYNGYKNLKFLAEINNKINDSQIKHAMHQVKLDPNNKTRVKHYSMGMKQKLGIAQAIMENQDIIILDEPFNALDFDVANDIRELLKKLQDEGKTIIITSHTHSDIEKLCDEVYIILNKKLYELTNELKSKYFNTDIKHNTL